MTLSTLGTIPSGVKSSNWKIKNQFSTKESGLSMFYTPGRFIFRIFCVYAFRFCGTVALGGLIAITLAFE
jgi:hypothetical protein